MTVVALPAAEVDATEAIDPAAAEAMIAVEATIAVENDLVLLGHATANGGRTRSSVQVALRVHRFPSPRSIQSWGLSFLRQGPRWLAKLVNRLKL